MSQDLVSVVITTYGRDVKLLSQAIQSVREQTYKEIELILVDDNGEGTEIQKKNQKMFSKSGDVCYVPIELDRIRKIAARNFPEI